MIPQRPGNATRSRDDLTRRPRGYYTGSISMRNVYDPDAFAIWEQEIVPAVTRIAIAGRS
jgi:hypothetical protein